MVTITPIFVFLKMQFVMDKQIVLMEKMKIWKLALKEESFLTWQPLDAPKRIFIMVPFGY